MTAQIISSNIKSSDRSKTNSYQSSFKSVQKAIISLVGDLRRLRSFSQELNLDQSIPLIDDVIERSENKSFSVAIVGEFNRGKSTFINALLGRDILPSDILPCSATLNPVNYEDDSPKVFSQQLFLKKFSLRFSKGGLSKNYHNGSIHLR